jgi:hypothetical protein
MTQVTVFGGTGFLGRRIVECLSQEGATLRVAVRHPERVNTFVQSVTGGRAMPNCGRRPRPVKSRRGDRGSRGRRQCRVSLRGEGRGDLSRRSRAWRGQHRHCLPAKERGPARPYIGH